MKLVKTDLEIPRPNAGCRIIVLRTRQAAGSIVVPQPGMKSVRTFIPSSLPSLSCAKQFPDTKETLPQAIT